MGGVPLLPILLEAAAAVPDVAGLLLWLLTMVVFTLLLPILRTKKSVKNDSLTSYERVQWVVFTFFLSLKTK